MQKNVSSSREVAFAPQQRHAYGWFQTTQQVQALCIAHAVATEPADKDALLKAMILEADYGLGRNPLNMVQMTGLGSRHCGRHLHHRPQRRHARRASRPHALHERRRLGQGATWPTRKWYANKGYPTWKEWPHGEALWHAPYCYSNNEFTPQQTMRGKMACWGICTHWAIIEWTHRLSQSAFILILRHPDFGLFVIWHLCGVDHSIAPNQIQMCGIEDVFESFPSSATNCTRHKATFFGIKAISKTAAHAAPTKFVNWAIGQIVSFRGGRAKRQSEL